MGGFAANQSRIDHAPSDWLRANWTVQRSSRVCPHCACAVGGLGLSIRNAERTARDAWIDDVGRLHDRAVWVYRRAAGVAVSRSNRPRSVYRRGIYESVFRCTDELAPAYSMFGIVRERHGPTHNDFACPYGHFPTKDGKWVAIACATDKLFMRLAQAMGRPELASHSTYGDQTARLESRHDVNEIVRDWCGSLTREEVLTRCFETGHPAGPLNTIADIFGDRQFHARRNLVAIRR